MDPMDYAFNHPSSSEAPYHIAVSSVSPPWITYSSGPDAGRGLDPVYLPPASTLPNPFLQDHSAYAPAYQHYPTYGNSLPWSPSFVHSSAPQDHALSRPINLSRTATQDIDRHAGRARHLQTWNPGPRLDPQQAQQSSLPNSGPQAPASQTCSSSRDTNTPQDEALGLSVTTIEDDALSLHGERISNRDQRWRTPSHEDDDEIFRDVLPPLRRQPSFQSNDIVSNSTLPILQPTTLRSSNSRLRLSRSNHVPQMPHSMSDVGENIVPRFEAAIAPLPISSPSSFTRNDRQSPTSRFVRTSRSNMLDVQRPIFSFDVGSNPRLPSTAPSTVNSSGVSSLSPRRQRSSRPGPRRHMAAPRSPSRFHGQQPIDKSLVQDFLASQDIVPTESVAGYSYSAIEETIYRNILTLQGTMGPARVARKSLINSLVPIPAEELPEDEKACTICYGSFGVESPEGTTEQALRLPDCNHIFGSACLRTWLEDSDRCPYCRKKLPSEPKWFASAAKRILGMIKRPSHISSDVTDNETCLTIIRGYDRGGWLQSPPPSATLSRSPLTNSRLSAEQTLVERRAMEDDLPDLNAGEMTHTASDLRL